MPCEVEGFSEIPSSSSFVTRFIGIDFKSNSVCSQASGEGGGFDTEI